MSDQQMPEVVSADSLMELLARIQGKGPEGDPCKGLHLVFQKIEKREATGSEIRDAYTLILTDEDFPHLTEIVPATAVSLREAPKEWATTVANAIEGATATWSQKADEIQDLGGTLPPKKREMMMTLSGIVVLIQAMFGITTAEPTPPTEG